MTVTQDILNVGQAGLALGIAGANIKLATKKNKKPKDFIKTGAATIVGTSFLSVNAGIIGGLD